VACASLAKEKTMPDNSRQYGKWSKEELRKAEVTASQFLEENSTQIADTMSAKARFLTALLERLAAKETSFENRLEFFARVSEVASLIQEDANGFFDLASQPVVARILATVPKE
jgi:hypothetical protein